MRRLRDIGDARIELDEVGTADDKVHVAEPGRRSYWLWGTRGFDAELALVVAAPDHAVLSGFEEVGPGREIPCRACGSGVRDERIYVVRQPRRPLAELWPTWRDYR